MAQSLQVNWGSKPTIEVPETPYDRAIIRAAEMAANHDEPFIWKVRTGALVWHVDSLSKQGVNYTVVLGPCGELETASCQCEARNHPTCIHRALAFLRFQNWLESDDGQAWAESYYCAVDGCYAPAMVAGGECKRHVKETDAILEQAFDRGEWAAIIAKDESDLFGDW